MTDVNVLVTVLPGQVWISTLQVLCNINTYCHVLFVIDCIFLTIYSTFYKIYGLHIKGT